MKHSNRILRPAHPYVPALCTDIAATMRRVRKTLPPPIVVRVPDPRQK